MGVSCPPVNTPDWGRPYGVSDMAATGLRERLLAGLNSTLGGCQFVKSLRRGRSAGFYVVRELGRTPGPWI